MKVIACVDNAMGLCFNHRRVSRDQVVIDQIQSLPVFYISVYSKKLYPKGIVIDNANILSPKDIYLIEDEIPNEDDVNEIVLYQWNRDYPSDLKLSYQLENWRCIESVDFAGKSHDTITRKRYIQ